MLEQIAEESFNVQTVDISFIELQVEGQMLPLGRNRKRTDGGNFTALIRVVMHGCLSLWCPSSAQVGNEQKATFIEENQMGTKFFGFFLYKATGSASIFGSLPHPFARLYALAFGNSIPSSSLFSKHGQDDTLPQTAFLLLQQYASESISQLNNQPSKVPSIGSSQAFSAGLLLVVKGVQGLAWILTPRSLLYHIPQPSVLYYLARLLQHWLLFYNLCQTQVKLLLEVFSFPIVARFQVVSCHYFNMYLLFMRSSIIANKNHILLALIVTL